MSNFVLIFLCMGLGVLVKRTRKFPPTTAAVLNAVVIHISLPAVILLQIPALLRTTEITPEMLIPVSMSWILILSSWLFFSTLGKAAGWRQSEVGALIMTAGFSNTSFVGFPLLESLLGPEALKAGVLVDQLGCCLALSTLGIFLAARYSEGEGRALRLSQLGFKIVTFPPFIALLVAFLWYFTGTSDNAIAMQICERLSLTMVPLALISVGFQLQLQPHVLAQYWKQITAGLAFKLALMPALFVILYGVIFESSSLATHVTILESAMAPMITAAVIAMEFGLSAEIAGLMMGVGIPLSLATVPAWHFILNSFKI